MTLDIGCGSRKTEPDAIGIDVSPDSAADHVWNLDRYPWPLEDARFSRFEYFTGRDFPSFAGAPFRFDIVDCTLTFGGNFVLDNLGRLISGASLKWYERHAAWIFPALDIRCHLRARKQA